MSDPLPSTQEMLEFLPDSPLAHRQLACQQLIAGENINQAAKIALEAHKKSSNKRTTCHITAQVGEELRLIPDTILRKEMSRQETQAALALHT